VFCRLVTRHIPAIRRGDRSQRSLGARDAAAIPTFAGSRWPSSRKRSLRAMTSRSPRLGLGRVRDQNVQRIRRGTDEVAVETWEGTLWDVQDFAIGSDNGSRGIEHDLFSCRASTEARGPECPKHCSCIGERGNLVCLAGVDAERHLSVVHADRVASEIAAGLIELDRGVTRRGRRAGLRCGSRRPARCDDGCQRDPPNLSNHLESSPHSTIDMVDQHYDARLTPGPYGSRHDEDPRDGRRRVCRLGVG
jgi:hypothetical protein